MHPYSGHVSMSLQVYFLSPDEGGRKKPYTNNYQSSLFCKTWNAPAVLQLQGKEMVMPGEDIPCKFVCTKFMVSICSKFMVSICSKFMVVICSKFMVSICSKFILFICSKFMVSISTKFIVSMCKGHHGHGEYLQ